MNGTARQDIVWMDWAKLIGIFLVVFGHLLQNLQDWRTGNWQYVELQELWNVIYIFHMPLFFVLSGYMYKESHSFKKIFYSLVVPYFIYQLLFLPAAFAMNVRNESFSIGFLCKQLLGCVLGDGYNTPISFYDCLPCWFIVSMIQIRLFFHFVPINKRSIISLLILCPAVLILLKVYNINLIFCLDSTCMAIPYFLIGYYIAKRNVVVSRFKSSGGGYFCSLLCLITLLLIYKINGTAQMNGPSFGNSVLLNYLGGLSGSLMIIFFVLKFKCIGSNSKLIARNTLFLIFYHWVVLLVFGFVGFFSMWKLIDNLVWAISIMVIYAILVLYSSIPVINYLNNKYPIVLGKKRII